MDNIGILRDYFTKFKSSKNLNSDDIKKIDLILGILNNSKHELITDLTGIVDIIKKCDSEEISKNKRIDNILYDVLFNLIVYNNKIMFNNKEVNEKGIDQDITFDNIDVGIKEVLDYLNISSEGIDSNLLDDLSKYIDVNVFKEFSIAIKTDNGLRRVLFDKIDDKNVLISILLHSKLDIVDNIIEIFQKEKANLNKVVSNIPSIFIKDLISSKLKYNIVLTGYDNFIDNYKLIKKCNFDFKKMLNQSVFFVNDVNKNMVIIESIGNIVKNDNALKVIIESLFNVIAINNNTLDIVINNLKLLDEYIINTIDNNNVSVLVNPNMSEYIDKRGLKGAKSNIINENRNTCKDNKTYDKIDGTSIEEGYDESRIKKAFK